MAKNYRHQGHVLTHSPSSDVLSGSLVLMNGLAGVALSDIPAGGLGAVQIQGVFTLPKGAVSVGQGAKVYWDAGAGALTTTASGNTLVGRAAAPASTTDATVDVILNA